jgi:hypothetical protein
MYNLRSKKNEIQQFQLIDNELYYKIIGNDSILLNDSILVDNENQGYFQFDKYLCLNHEDSTDLINVLTKIKITLPTTFLGTGYYDNNFITSKCSIREAVGLYSSKYVIYQLFPFKELYELPHRYDGSGYRFENRYIQIQNERKLLKSLSLLSGEYEWEFDLQEKLGQYDSIGEIYGVVNKLLWLVSERGVLFGISINDGKVLHHLNFDRYNTFQQYGTVQMQYFRSLFDEKKQLLTGFYEKRYWEIDLKEANPSLILMDIKVLNPTYYVEEFASPEGMVFDENYIYFRDNELATVGILNRKTKQIDWQHRLYDAPAVISDIQVSTGKLYALDTMGVLHIFEKETIE